MSLIKAGSSIIPIPEGVNPADMDSIIENMPRYEAKHFVMPFLAHALGTLTGALIASAIAATNKKIFGLVVGCFFLLGGILMAFQVPAPFWFEITDIFFAYIPMGWLGAKIGMKIKSN